MPQKMGVTEHQWERWLERLYSLRRDKRGSHERPHKPVLLLSIMDLLDRELIKSNAVRLTDELVATFKRYFDAVKEGDDRPSIENPFYFLAGDGFWQVFARGEQDPLYKEGYASSAPSVGRLREEGVTGHFDKDLWTLLENPLTRHQLREALIVRYFPENRKDLASLGAESESTSKRTVVNELPPAPARNAAFRRTILEIYDYRCAACGLRVLLDQTESLVEAAHLIPFEVSPNDKPTNGMALCPNHHWAMDRYLIAPCPDPKRLAGVWRVNKERLDDRIEGQRELVALADRAVIAPNEAKFYPAIESLRWREERLTAA